MKALYVRFLANAPSQKNTLNTNYIANINKTLNCHVVGDQTRTRRRNKKTQKERGGAPARQTTGKARRPSQRAITNTGSTGLHFHNRVSNIQHDRRMGDHDDLTSRQGLHSLQHQLSARRILRH